MLAQRFFCFEALPKQKLDWEKNHGELRKFRIFHHVFFGYCPFRSCMVRTDSFKEHIATQTLLSNRGSSIKHLISNSSFDDGFGALNYKGVQNQ